MTFDFLIVGGGIAGAVLARTLDRAGCRVLLVDAPGLPSASRVAAGIVNPLTGRKLVKTWRADALFPFLHTFYAAEAAALDAHFFHPRAIYRPYRNLDEQSAYLTYTAASDVARYVLSAADNQHYNEYIVNPFGGLTVTDAGWLDISGYVENVKHYFMSKSQLIGREVSVKQLDFQKDSVGFNGIPVGKVIFCDGAAGRENPLFGWLPYNVVKGQILTAITDDYPIKEVVNQGVFILPLGNNLIRIGATYTWHDINWKTTDDGRTFLQKKVAEVLRVPYKIIDQQAGIRPATKDRRPFVGIHPHHPAVGIFSGLGAKGASLAPLLAHEFARHLLAGEELNPEVNIERYRSLYL
jgi:glycine/D-amino acid oxidase-like deaminating enzyme